MAYSNVKIQPQYPFENKLNVRSLLVLLCTGWIPIYQIIDFSGFISVIVILVTGIMALVSLANIRQKLYIIDCPYCGTKTVFPADEQGVDCTACAKRIIMANGIIKKVE